MASHSCKPRCRAGGSDSPRRLHPFRWHLSQRPESKRRLSKLPLGVRPRQRTLPHLWAGKRSAHCTSSAEYVFLCGLPAKVGGKGTNRAIRGLYSFLLNRIIGLMQTWNRFMTFAYHSSLFMTLSFALVLQSVRAEEASPKLALHPKTAKASKVETVLHHPSLPQGAGHPIDRWLHAYRTEQ